ncbi:MAG: phosphate ABC transporter substrate-binding/OmpA family protein [Chitinophagales bacterium]
MAAKLTTFSKLLITLLIVGGIGFLILKLTNSESIRENFNSKDKPAVKNKGKADVKVGVFSWGGYAPGFYFNEGFDANGNSRFSKEYGIDVSFEVIDDFDANRQAWKAGDVDLIGTTADALPTEMEGLKEFDPRIVFQVDWSRGGDAIIAKRGINSINDLKGKTVAVTPSTPSQTFLLWMLEAANMTLSDINILEVPSAIDAATAFKGDKNVDAAVVWSPDDEISIREVPGSTVLQSTREASHIVADVFIAKKEWIDEHKDELNSFYEGWMKGAAEINSSQENKEKAARIMAEGTFFSDEDALASINNVRLTTHGDNLNFFGKNADYKGVTGEILYTKMTNEYIALGFAETPYSWRMLAYPGAISSAQLTGPAHNAEGQKDFQPATEEDKTAPAVASKPVSISFATGQFALDANAKTIVDLQFSDVAKAFGNSRVRVEGNTDNVGGYQMNVDLSKKRAQSVADYLQKQYNMSPNRFIIVGNGPNKPVPGCESNATEECRAQNRRTEFQLLK